MGIVYIGCRKRVKVKQPGKRPSNGGRQISSDYVDGRSRLWKRTAGKVTALNLAKGTNESTQVNWKEMLYKKTGS